MNFTDPFLVWSIALAPLLAAIVLGVDIWLHNRRNKK